MSQLQPDDAETSFWKMPRGSTAVLIIVILVAVAGGIWALSKVPSFGEYGFSKDFPPIHNLSSVRISLQRSLCFGRCPAYSLEIFGNGEVRYHGQECVAERGVRTGRISSARVAQLIDQFKAARYFSLKDNYFAQITDNPAFVTSIQFDGHKKKVVDYAGPGAGMPQSVRDLEDAIDKVAGSERWVFGQKRSCFGEPVDDSWRRQPKS